MLWGREKGGGVKKKVLGVKKRDIQIPPCGRGVKKAGRGSEKKKGGRKKGGPFIFGIVFLSFSVLLFGLYVFCLFCIGSLPF